MTFKNKYISVLAAGLLCTLPVAAQLHESINVEGKYVPEIIRIDRIHTFPKAMKFTLGASPLDYEIGGVAASFSPRLLAMPATGWGDTRYVSRNKGYLELGAGSWLNSTLSAGYRFIDDATTLAGIRLQHNSTSLWKPDLSEATRDVSQYRYDESIGLYMSHLFIGYGRLDAAIDYHVGLFNYYGFYTTDAAPDTHIDAPSQTLNDFSLRLDWHSLIKPGKSLRYDASARIRHFAFRALALPEIWHQNHAKGNRETDIELAGNIRMPWDNGSTVGLDAKLNMLMYGGQSPVFTYSQGTGLEEVVLNRPDNYGLLTLTPYYRFSRGLLDIRLGADIDMAFNAGPEGNRYSFLHIAPDVKFALQSGQFGMFLNLLGGSGLNTLASLWQNDYYMMPALTSTRPTYTPLDAVLGFCVGPFSGFSLGIEGSFRSSKNVPLGGWYQTWMNRGAVVYPGMKDTDGADVTSDMLYSMDTQGISINGFSVGGYLSYKPSEMFSFLAKGSLQPQKGETGYFNGYDRPKVTARLEASVKPVSPLKITAGFDYKGKRAIYTRAARSLQSGTVDDRNGTLSSLALPDLYLLNLSASWNFTPDFSIWLQGDNILNRHDVTLPMLPAQGLGIVAGLKVLF